jgi:hypothetical protein
MVRDYLSSSVRPGPLVDLGEKERLSFWRHHAVAIQSDLLGITGWLGFDPARAVLTATTRGVRAVRADSRPPNVLFLVPPEGTRTYLDWEWCLRYLRLEQSRRWLVRQQVLEAEAKLESAEAELRAIRDRHARLDARLREIAGSVRRERAGDPARMPAGSPTELVQGLAEARENLTAFRAAQRRKETIQLRLEGLRDHLVPRVYPGLWARVNAFLDLQALAVANVAGEEFRKSPRPLAGLAARFERELEED